MIGLPIVAIPDPNPFLKLWWKAVDISATVIATIISAAIVWAFAEAFIKRKHDLELALEKKKHEQKAKLDRELAAENKLRRNRAHLASLAAELDRFKAEALTNLKRIQANEPFDQDLPVRFSTWLHTSGLSAIQVNADLAWEFSPSGHFQRKFILPGAVGVSWLDALEYFFSRIQETHIPTAEEDCLGG